MKVSEALEMMDPEYRPIIQEMVVKAGFNDEITVDEFKEHYPLPNPDLVLEQKFAILSLTKIPPGKFSAKLTFDQRCEVLALSNLGFPKEQLAKMYGIDRRTVTHICTAKSPHYKNVREEELSLGESNFKQRYVTDDLVNRALSFKQEMSANRPKNNPLANEKAGLNPIRGTFCQKMHTVMIAWRTKDQGVEESGWYFQDLDGDFPDDWFSPTPYSRQTSKACYAAMIHVIQDKKPKFDCKFCQGTKKVWSDSLRKVVPCVECVKTP